MSSPAAPSSRERGASSLGENRCFPARRIHDSTYSRRNPFHCWSDFQQCSTIPAFGLSEQDHSIHSPANAEIFVRYGGHGPVVVLLHGYAENSDSWAPLAEDLM
jgi:hypothetical protein